MHVGQLGRGTGEAREINGGGPAVSGPVIAAAVGDFLAPASKDCLNGAHGHRRVPVLLLVIRVADVVAVTHVVQEASTTGGGTLGRAYYGSVPIVLLDGWA